MKRNAVKKVIAFILTIVMGIGMLSTNTTALAKELPQSTTKDHNKQVIGYITQWDAWKGTSAGVPAQGALTHLNIDYSKYTILNYSFFGVANDGSLHSGDFRDKNIYKPEVQQKPAPMLYTDIYSSWDLFILFGEVDGVYSINADIAAKAKAQGFDVVEWGNTWSKPSWGLYDQPLPMPLKKEGGAPGLLELAKQNGVKVNASIGGWSMCKHFSEVAADPAKRAKFVQDCVRLIDMGFDGIDLDWEYPGPYSGMNFTGKEIDYNNFVTLTREIRQAIGNDKLITSCFSADTAKIDRINWGEVDKYVDYYNFMTYDYNGGWSDKAGHNSPLYSYSDAEAPTFNWDYLYQYLSNKNINLSKVNMGVAFYGRGVVTDGSAALNAKTVKRAEFVQPDGDTITAADYTNWPKDVFDGTPYYYYIKNTALASNSGWTKHWDDEAKVPYLTKGNFFLSYDDEASVGYKAQYVKDKNLGGVIVWTVYEDLELGGSVTNYGTKLKKWSDVKSPLIDKVNEVFAKGNGAAAADPAFNIKGGSYETAQNIILTCSTADAAIRYTLDGSEPTVESTLYQEPISITETTTIKAKAFKEGLTDSATVSAVYTIGTAVATPEFDPQGGTYTEAQSITITCTTEGAAIHYTTDGTEPTAESSQYAEPINVESTTTVKAKAFKESLTESVTASADYTIGAEPKETVAVPTFDPEGGTFDQPQNVAIACATEGAAIHYTTDGTEPTAESPQYTDTISIESTTTVKAKAFKEGMTDSATAAAAYTIQKDSPAAEWQVGISYKVGDKVSYNGNNYECIQPNSSLEGWDPVSVPALWKLLN